ncbi:MAG: glycosyltransferase family 39 protein [Acidobacteria bacterium]|nr:glycosyltransferase family 39 protein [Acidobacteriota bacterium]
MNRRTIFSWILVVIGGLLLLAAVLVSNAGYHQALVTNPVRSLSWGPTLFRALLAVHGLALIAAGLIWQRNVQSAGFSRNAGNVQDIGLSRNTGIFLVVLSAVALTLRLFRLNTDLWFDEILTLLDFVRLPMGDIVTSFPSQNQHMFFSVLSRISVVVFGESAAAVRLPSVLFGVASLWALFFLAKKVAGVRAALLTCTLLTFSYHHIWFSQNARGYMGLMFFTTLVTWLWMEAWERGGGWWVSYAVAAALGAWIHMTMVFVVAAHCALYLVWLARPTLLGSNTEERNRNWWQPILAWTLCGTLTLQLYALALPEFLSAGLHETSEPSEWTTLWWMVKESVRSLRIGFSGLVILLAGGVMVANGWLGLFKRNRMASLAMVVPAVFSGAVMVIMSHNIWPRFFFFLMGFGLLIAVYGALAVPQLLRWFVPAERISDRLLTNAGVGLAVLMIVASTLTIPRCYALPKQDYTGARDFVERSRHSDDAVVAVGLAGVAYSKYFAAQWPMWNEAQTQAELDAVRKGHSDVWLVYTIPIQVKAYRPDIWQAIESDFEVVKVFPGTLGGGEVFVCRQKSTISQYRDR